MAENLKDSVMGNNGGDLSINGIATYQPNDGLMELKMVNLACLVVHEVIAFHVII